MELSIPLTNELALRLVALREGGETLEETTTRLILQAYQDHKSERAPSPTTETSAEG